MWPQAYPIETVLQLRLPLARCVKLKDKVSYHSCQMLTSIGSGGRIWSASASERQSEPVHVEGLTCPSIVCNQWLGIIRVKARADPECLHLAGGFWVKGPSKQKVLQVSNREAPSGQWWIWNLTVYLEIQRVLSLGRKVSARKEESQQLRNIDNS